MLAPHETHRVTPLARQMAAIIQRDEPDGAWRCHYCRTPLHAADRPRDWSLPHPERDHVIPKSRGGKGTIANSVIACQGCNVRKGNKLLGELPEGWNAWRVPSGEE